MIHSLCSIHVFVQEKKKISWATSKLGSATGPAFRKEYPLMLALCGQFCPGELPKFLVTQSTNLIYRPNWKVVSFWFGSVFFRTISGPRETTTFGASMKCRKPSQTSPFFLVGYSRMSQEKDTFCCILCDFWSVRWNWRQGNTAWGCLLWGSIFARSLNVL